MNRVNIVMPFLQPYTILYLVCLPNQYLPVERTPVMCWEINNKHIMYITSNQRTLLSLIIILAASLSVNRKSDTTHQNYNFRKHELYLRIHSQES